MEVINYGKYGTKEMCVFSLPMYEFRQKRDRRLFAMTL